MYTNQYLLDKLKELADKIGRTPRKTDIEQDKNMPSTTTYSERFGGLVEATKLIGLEPTMFIGLTVDKFINLLIQYYNDYGVSPRAKDFDSNPLYPHSCYMRSMGFTWIEALGMANLPIYSRGSVWIANRDAELQIKEILTGAGFNIIDLKENRSNKGSFIINNKVIRVRKSQTYIIANKKGTGYSWKFKLHVNNFVHVDYYICLGMDEHDVLDSIYILPASDVEAKECISINPKRQYKSKYYQYKVDADELDTFTF